jgi:hypothetical protein
MWVMAASPLLTANDVRNMSADIKEILVTTSFFDVTATNTTTITIC